MVTQMTEIEEQTTDSDDARLTVESSDPLVEVPLLKKREFIERVVAKSDLKKKDVKPAVEAAILVLSEALNAGETVVLQPLGKIKIIREKELPNGKVYTARIRVSNNVKTQDEEIAD